MSRANNNKINILGGTLEYQTEITATTTVLSTEKGINKLYPFKNAAPQTVQVNSGV